RAVRGARGAYRRGARLPDARPARGPDPRREPRVAAQRRVARDGARTSVEVCSARRRVARDGARTSVRGLPCTTERAPQTKSRRGARTSVRGLLCTTERAPQTKGRRGARTSVRGLPCPPNAHHRRRADLRLKPELQTAPWHRCPGRAGARLRAWRSRISSP